MADKKYSITLSAKEQLSQAFESAGKASGRLRSDIEQTNRQLKEMGATSKRAAEFGSLEKAMAGNQKAMAGARKEAKAAADGIKALSEQQAKYKKELKQAEEQLQRMQSFVGPVTPAQQAATVEATQKVAELKKGLSGVTRELNQTQKAEKAANSEARQLSDTLGSQGRRLGSLSRDLGAAGVNTKALGAEQLRLKRNAEDATAAMERQQARLRTINDAQAKMAANQQTRRDLAGEALMLAAKAAPAVYAAKKAIDYEAAFAGVTKVVSFKDQAEENQVRTDMMRLAAQYGVDQVGMTNIVAAAGEAGIGRQEDGTTDTRELLRFAGDASRMAVAMDMTAAEAGTTIAKWRSAMGLDQDQAMALADYANEISNQMAAKPAEVARVMLRQGATTMKAGFTDRQAAALAASLIAGGEGEEVTATAMKNITGRLGKGFAATGAQKSALGMLGFDPEVLAKDMQNDAGGTLFKVLGAIGKQDADKQAAIISQLFGEEVVGAVSKLTTNTDLLKKAMRLAGDEAAYAGSMEGEYQNKAKTRQAMLQRAGSQFDRLIINMGNLLLPLVDEVVEPLANLAAKGSELMEASESARTAAGWIVKIGAGLLALKAGHIVFKGIGSVFSDMFQAGRIVKAKLGGRMDDTSRTGNAAARALMAVNRQLDRMAGRGGMGMAGAGGSGRRRRGQSRLGGLSAAEADIGRQRRRRNRGGRMGRFAGAGRMASLLGMGAGLMMMPETASAGEMIGSVADAGSGLASLASYSGMLGAVGKWGGKLVRPLGMIATGGDLIGAARAGDAVSAAGSAGDLAGSLGGGWAGAAAGAAMGSIVPGIGTAIGAGIGGLLGSWGGGELGGLLGESIASWFKKDKTADIDGGKPVAEAVVKEASKTEVKTENHFTLKFDVKASGDPEQDNALAKKIQDNLSQLLPTLMASTVAMDSRQDASLTGLGSD